MAEKKQLVLVVEGTVDLGAYWRTIVSDYIEKVIRKFCGDECKEAASSTVDLALVQFNAHGSYSSCLLQRSGWTRNVDYFLEWLSCMHFSGGGFGDTAIAEGLAEVLMMCPAPNETQTQPSETLQRHCILVAASNPYALPTPVYCPPNKSETQSVSCLFDAEAVAKLFPQCCVSLSVICPKQLPKLKAIFNAGKRNPSAIAPTIDSIKNPHFLILISENFMEAWAALSPSTMTNGASNQTPLCMEVASVSKPPPSASAVNESLLTPQTLSVGNIPVATVIVEPGTAVSLVASPQLQTGKPNSPLSSTSHELKSGPAVISGSGPPPLAGTAQVTQRAGTMMAASGTSQQVQEMKLNNNMGTNVGPSQPTSSAPQSRLSEYVKIWEGELCGTRQNQTVNITRLEARSNSPAAESLAEDWPSRLVVEKLVSRDLMSLLYRKHNFERIALRAHNEHGFLEQMEKKELCAIIRLPSKTLLLSISANPCLLFGMLFSGGGVGAEVPSRAQSQGASQEQGSSSGSKSEPA